MSGEKILICVINNTGLWESYFCNDLLKLYEETKKIYPNTEVQNIQASSVAQMRNYSCRYAMGKFGKIINDNPTRYDYLVQLDTDHHYPKTFIIDLMKHKKDIVTGCTSSRHQPFQQTQFKEFIKEIRSDDNIANPTPDEELMEIAASGPVGMLIKVDILEKLKYPYYKITYIGSEETNNVESVMGEDVNFCHQLKEAGIKIWLDPKITFPHNIKNVFVNRGNIQL